MEIREILLEQLIPSRNLRIENPDDVNELTESIREHGLLQPIRVRPLGADIYQIIAGHRRVMAHRALGLKTIASVVVKESDKSAAVQSIVENLQREDLTPLELARGIQSLVLGFQLNIENIARLISKSPERIRTWIRISNLPDDVLTRLESGERGTQRVTGLTPRHIEPFIRGLPSQEERQRSESASALYEERLSDVRELQQELDRRNTRITAHMADDIARSTRQGNITVSEAIDKVLLDPDRYRYRPALPTPDEIEGDTFADYKRRHSELIALAYKLKPEIAVSFSADKKRSLFERLDSLNKLLEPYRQALLSRGDASREERRQLAAGE